MSITTFSEISLLSYLFKWLGGLESKLRIGLAKIGQATLAPLSMLGLCGRRPFLRGYCLWR